jgi:signal peptidase complex subunit 2
MKSLEFVQSHTLSDVRLALGYTAVLAVAIAAYYEYRVGFQAAKGWSTLSVGVYFLLNAALYCWTTYIERDVVYIGSKSDLRVLLYQTLTA